MHQEFERLLPWYVNGTLAEAEMDRLNRHLAGCGRCAERVRSEIRLARLYREAPADAAAVASVDHAWGRLTARLPRSGSRPRRAAVGLAALCLAVASAAFLLGQQLQPAPYGTLSSPAHHSGPVIQLVVTPGTAEADALRLVEQAGGAVLTRSEPAGIYRVGLASEAEADRLMARLERMPAVRWVARERP
ncbi:MAG TPA: zf-HC2 domain-containing protein [Pseudomonadales bacterium]